MSSFFVGLGLPYNPLTAKKGYPSYAYFVWAWETLRPALIQVSFVDARIIINNNNK